jgi:CheY-like chemotaxis protein
MCNRRRVLVVDDQASIRAVVHSLLTEEGYTVLQAEHGAAALRVVQRDPPCLVLLDVRMPVMDGRDFVAAYRRTPPPHAVLVLLSAERDSRRLALELGAAAVLAKPFDLQRLLDVVEQNVPTHVPAAAGRENAPAPRCDGIVAKNGEGTRLGSTGGGGGPARATRTGQGQPPTVDDGYC